MKEINFGVIGLGLMGKEFISAASRWCSLAGMKVKPVIKGVCSPGIEKHRDFIESLQAPIIVSSDYKEIISSENIDAVYCAVPHHLHKVLYSDIIRAGKHLLGEKPFGIDKASNTTILKVIKENPGVFVRCSSEFPFYPAAQRAFKWIKDGNCGKIIEARFGFHHSSDLDLTKPVNWKRSTATNGGYGCMGDLGFHTHHIPLRLGWTPRFLYAVLQNIVPSRPDKSGGMDVCDTWDNASLVCTCVQRDGEFPLVLETKRMYPGATNTWFFEVLGTRGSVKFSTRNPKTIWVSVTEGPRQSWVRTDLGMDTLYPTITGNIFEFGFTDCFQQMLASFVDELSDEGAFQGFGCGTPRETAQSHAILDAALMSHENGCRVEVEY